jgi:hypothetical protein
MYRRNVWADEVGGLLGPGPNVKLGSIACCNYVCAVLGGF